jgi:hypothetical protein
MNNKSIMKFIDLKGVGGPEVLGQQELTVLMLCNGKGNMLRLQVPQ